VKISLVPMRALPSASPARSPLRPSGSSPVVSAALVREEDAGTCPASVEQASWSLLRRRIADAQSGSAIANPELRSAVRVVVRELRAKEEGWEAVYAALESAVRTVPARPAPSALGLEVHASRGASIVAHMHCWADVERLAEIEDGGPAT
jgi:hypothetical protein